MKRYLLPLISLMLLTVNSSASAENYPLANHIDKSESKLHQLELRAGDRQMILFVSPDNFLSDLNCVLKLNGEEVASDLDPDTAGCLMFYTPTVSGTYDLVITNDSITPTNYKGYYNY